MIYLIQSKNPETLFLEPLKLYIKDLTIPEIFPNFDTVRVGTVHPFAILLAQEITGSTQQMNLFPSITVANTSSQEESDTLGFDHEIVEINSERISELDTEVQEKKWTVASSLWDQVKTQALSGTPVYGIRYSSRLEGQVDFNIWSDNKDITSFLFDTVYQFVIHQRTVLKSKDVNVSTVSGRRSGDINLDFGRILYGANIQANISVAYDTIALDLEIADIQSVIVNVQGYPIK